MDQINEDNPGGGGGDSKADAPKETPSPASGEKAEEAGNSTDDFGYATPPKEEKPEDKKESGEKKESPEKSEEVEASLTGYGDGEKPPVVAPPEEKKEEPATPPAEPDELDKAIGDGLPKEIATEIKTFAQSIKDKPFAEQVKAFADARRKELADAEAWNKNQQKERENAVLRDKAARFEELKNDKDFGGENFKKNLMEVDKVLKIMPNTKKLLTDTKGMLQPWLMRDLAILAKKLNGTENLNNGEPPSSENHKAEEGDFLKDMYQ